MPKLLRVGTDCSGIEAPIQALIQLKIPFEHVFSSEIDKYCIQSIKANYTPKIIFGDKDGLFPEGDITKRDIKEVPDIDLYICGFPCQPFSQAGKRKGFKDKRGNVFWSCLEVIEKKKPKYFILENVRGLLTHDKGNTWKVIWEELNNIKDYNIQWCILNTKDYNIPQNRSRLYIIGTYKQKFRFPDKIKLKKKLFVDNDDDRQHITSVRHEKILSKLATGCIFIELAFGVSTTRSFNNSGVLSSCITANTRLWCVPKHRYANTSELLYLQGFPRKFKIVVSNTQLKKQIGNSMSVNVVKELIKELFPSNNIN
jgi:DNA (cytosine-5)-methyltransferase 1